MRYRFRSCLFVPTTLGAVSAVMLAPPAWAQDVSGPTDQSHASDSGEIIVTATRDTTRASKTPVALAAIKGDTLTAQGITNPLNLAELVPNISINRAGTNQVGLQVTIRGVTSTDTTDKGDPSAAFMLDGIYLARPQAQEVSFFDVDRVEVLRGPQGTLFGRNTTAGLVNIITNRPVIGAVKGSLEADYGSFDQLRLTGMINLPVGDKVAIRAAANLDRRDTYMIAGPRFTSALDPFKKNISGRLSGLLDLGQGQLVLTGDYASLEGSIVNQLPVSNFYEAGYNVNNGITPLYTGNRLTAKQLRMQNGINSTPTHQDSYTWGASADLKYDLGPVTLNYLGSYRRLRRVENGVAIPDASTFPNSIALPIRFRGKYWQNSQELRLSTNGTGPLKAQVGGYYFKESSQTLNYYEGGSTPRTSLIAAGQPGYIFGFPQNPTVAESWAGFGQMTYAILPTLRLTAGGRYSSDLKYRNGFTVTCRSLACDQTSAATNSDVRRPNIARRRFSRVTWRAGFDFDVGPTTMAYGTVSTGYKAGGFNDGCLVGVAPLCTITQDAGLYYKPETLTSYEAGVKMRLLNNALTMNLAAFHTDFQNIQLAQFLDAACGGPCTVTTNAAAAKIDGVELEAVIRPGPNTRFDFSTTWLNARYTKFLPRPDTDWAGRKLDRAPQLAATAGVTQTILLGNGGNLEGNVRTNVSDSFFLASLPTRKQFRVPGYTKTDLVLTYNAPGKSWYLQGYLKNIENNVVVSSVATGNFALVNYMDPRTYGVRAGVKF